MISSTGHGSCPKPMVKNSLVSLCLSNMFYKRFSSWFVTQRLHFSISQELEKIILYFLQNSFRMMGIQQLSLPIPVSWYLEIVLQTVHQHNHDCCHHISKCHKCLVLQGLGAYTFRSPHHLKQWTTTFMSLFNLDYQGTHRFFVIGYT